jgi:lipopolysaccharide transport system ATP-binding protein
MNEENAIEVVEVGKFFYRDIQPNSIREDIVNRFKNIRKKDGFWALKKISFNLPKGAVLGILGHNGAGKSVLLKILAGVIKPTSGEARIRGRVGALLELGTGFHPELSGRDNIILNGTLIGFSRSQINKYSKNIIDFAGIQEFIDDPVKHYSSGMMMRLAFSIATTLVPEIVFLDEVWAVGDAEFQEKSAKRVREIISDGRTVIIVSHSVETVKSICTHCLLLNKGEAVMFGDPDLVIERYKSIIND